VSKLKFLEMWAFALKIKEKFLVKKSNSKSILTLKRGLKG